jgi:hypothetical protein
MLALAVVWLDCMPGLRIPRSAIVVVQSHRDGHAVAQVLILIVALAVQIGRGARDASGRFAIWLVANVMALGAALLLDAYRRWMTWDEAMLLALAILVWPLVVELLVTAHSPVRETPLVALGVCVLAFVADALGCFLINAPYGSRARVYATALPFAALLVLPLAMQTLARTTIASRSLLAGGVAAGAAMALVVALAGPRGHGLSFALAAVWPLGAVLVVVARRFRSMTAIPLDHPVVADFGPARR